LKGRKLFFLDLDLEPAEQLEQIVDTLRREPATGSLPMPGGLRQMLNVRISA